MASRLFATAELLDPAAPLRKRAAKTANGNNKLLQEDRSAHSWYRFVLSYPPHLVRDYLVRLGLTQRHRVLDPFCGTGTTLVECKKQGIPSVGIEANPMAFFASRVKTNWSIDPERLRSHARDLAAKVRKTLQTQGIPDEPTLGNVTRLKSSDLRTLPEESFRLLLKDSISPLPLHKTLVLVDEVRKSDSEKVLLDPELLAVAKGLVTTIGNLHFGPEVGIGPAKGDAPVVNTWLDNVLEMAHDIEDLQDMSDTPAEVYCTDSRRMLQAVAPGSIDAVITSPPYPNEKDYTRTTRLESVVLGLINNKAELRAFKQSLMRSNTRNVYKADDDDRWIEDIDEIRHIAEKIEARRIELGKTSGFERLYHRVAKLYFGGMARHLSELRALLRPGAQLAYVVGDQASYLRVMIRTGQLLAKIAVKLGYELVGVDLFRTRLATATREQLREEVVLLRWPGGA